MFEEIGCPSCQKRLRLPDDCFGSMVQCPACRHTFEARAEGTVPVLQPTNPAAVSVPRVPQLRVREIPQTDEPPERAERPRPYRRRGTPTTVPVRHRPALWILVSILVLLVVGIVAFSTRSTPKQNFNFGPVQVKRDRPRAAFELPPDLDLPVEEQQALTEKEIAAEIEPVLQELNRALQARDRQAIARHFDIARMCQQMVTLQVVADGALGDRRTFLGRVYPRFAEELQKRTTLDWAEFDIRDTKVALFRPRRGHNVNEAEVIVLHRGLDGFHFRMCWYVTKRLGTWRVFDVENIASGWRVTANVVPAAGSLGQQPIPIAMDTLHEAYRDVSINNNVVEADRKLNDLAGTALPKHFDAVRHMTTAIVRLHQQRAQDALAALDKADELRPGMTTVNLYRGYAHDNLRDWNKALDCLRPYEKSMGSDAVVSESIGNALRSLGRSQEAVQYYRKSLDFDPGHGPTFLNLLRVLGPGDDKSDVGLRFAKLRDPRKEYDLCADDCRAAQDWEELEQVAQAMTKIDPRHAAAQHHLAMAKAWSGRGDEALALYRAAQSLETDAGRRREFTLNFLQAMANGGGALQAYDKAPDRRQTFAFLAGELKRVHLDDDLHELVTRHQKSDPGDGALTWYRADRLVREGDYAAADKTFAGAKPEALDAQTLALFRPERVLAKYHTGQAAAALADLGPRRDTLQQLAGLCFQDKKYDLLETLLGEHAKTDPDDPELLSQRMRLRVVQGRVEEAAGFMKQALAREPADERRKQLVNQFLFAMVDHGKALEAYRASPDGQTFQVLAGDLLSMRKKDLEALLKAHAARTKTDTWLAFYTGELHALDQAWDKSAKYFNEARKSAAASDRQRILGRWTYAMVRAGRGQEAYDAEPTRETFNQVAFDLLQDRKAAELAALIAAHRGRAGDDAEFLMIEARAKLLLKQHEQAIPLFQEAHKKAADNYRKQDFVRNFVLEMAAAGRWSEGYDAALDKRHAFNTLARDFTSKKKDQELSKLLDVHRRSQPDDPWLACYFGESELLRGNFLEAERAFKEALSKAARNNEWTVRNGLDRARIRAGKTLVSYEEFGKGKSRGFENLAQLCVTEKNGAELRKLLAAHRQAYPEYRNAVAWEMEIKWLDKDYAGALALIDQHRQGVLGQVRHRWKTEGYLVRGLGHLKKHKEAIAEAEKLTARPGNNPFLLVLAHAAAGQVPETIAALEKSPDPYLVGDCYRDPVLGPILRSGAFRPFRDRFPEPKNGDRFLDLGDDF